MKMKKMMKFNFKYNVLVLLKVLWDLKKWRTEVNYEILELIF